MMWIAFTEREGPWPFTVSDTQEKAIKALEWAIVNRYALVHPFNNPIRAVRARPSECHNQGTSK